MKLGNNCEMEDERYDSYGNSLPEESDSGEFVDTNHDQTKLMEELEDGEDILPDDIDGELNF